MTEGMVVCLCVSPMKAWRLVPSLSPYGSRDSLQPQRDPELVWEGLTEPILRPKTKPVTATQRHVERKPKEQETTWSRHLLK